MKVRLMLAQCSNSVSPETSRNLWFSDDLEFIKWNIGLWVKIPLVLTLVGNWQYWLEKTLTY